MKNIFLLLSILLLMSCNNRIAQIELNRNDENQIRSVMKSQEDAWSKGDLHAFMDGYWKSDKLKFVGSRGITYGWSTTLNNYKRSYPNPKIMGKLHFDIDLMERLSSDTYYLIGRYTLTREKDTPTGYFNLIWKKINGKWKIVSDMTCG